MREIGTIEAVAAAASRAAEAEAEYRSALALRDAIIRQARSEGWSLRRIGQAAGLHPTAIRKIDLRIPGPQAKEDPR